MCDFSDVNKKTKTFLLGVSFADLPYGVKFHYTKKWCSLTFFIILKQETNTHQEAPTTTIIPSIMYASIQRILPNAERYYSR